MFLYVYMYYSYELDRSRSWPCSRSRINNVWHFCMGHISSRFCHYWHAAAGWLTLTANIPLNSGQPFVFRFDESIQPRWKINLVAPSTVLGGGWWQWRRQQSLLKCLQLNWWMKPLASFVWENVAKNCGPMHHSVDFTRAAGASAAGEQRLHQPVQRVCCVRVCLCVGAWVEEATLDALSLHSLAKAIASPSRPVNTAHWRTCTFIIKSHLHTCCSYTSCVIAMMVLWCTSAH